AFWRDLLRCGWGAARHYGPLRALGQAPAGVFSQLLLEALEAEAVLERRQQGQRRDVASAHPVDHLRQRDLALLLLDRGRHRREAGADELALQDPMVGEARPIDLRD